MIKVRKSQDRGHGDHGWLKTYHTFSFDEYFDPEHMGFRTLRVINEDTVEPGKGFGTHPHRDMEIITYVIEGAVEHKDSMGNGSVIRPGDVQRMSAGTGVTHSEFNPSPNERLHLLQIWILPEKKGLKPGYEQKTFSREEKLNRLFPVDVGIHQDVKLFLSILEKGKSVPYSLGNGRHAWVQVVKGVLDLNGTVIREGDGAAVSEERAVILTAKSPSEILFFDLA